MKPWHLRLFAFIVFAVSFWLPAIQVPTGSHFDPEPGWLCAWFATILAPVSAVRSLGEGLTGESVMALLAGSVNLLVVAVLLLSIWSRLVRTRLALVVLTVPGFIASWRVFAHENFRPMIGHFVWIAGALLFGAPEILTIVRSRASLPVAEPEATAAGPSANAP